MMHCITIPPQALVVSSIKFQSFVLNKFKGNKKDE